MENRTLKEAVRNTIHNHHSLTVEAIAEELGMSPNSLYRWCLPDQDEKNGTGARFPLKKLAPLVRVTGDFQILDYLENSLGRVAFDIPKKTCLSLKDVQNLAINAAAEFGDLMTEVAEDYKDDNLTKAEKRAIIKEGWEAITAIVRLISRVEDK